MTHAKWDGADSGFGLSVGVWCPPLLEPDANFENVDVWENKTKMIQRISPLLIECELFGTDTVQQHICIRWQIY